MFTDLKALAPCMPGAQLEASDGDEHRGSIKVKLGPIAATYAGVAAFESLERAERTAVLRAEGADTRGQGKASARITASFRETGTGTRVAIDTELTITGKVAQFGRGVVADVSDKLLGEFVERVHQTLLTDSNGVPPRLADSSVNALADRKSVVEGTMVSVRVDIGGARIIKKKK